MISYHDLGLLILFLIIAGLGIYAFFVLNNLNAILKNIRDLQTKHLSDLDKTLTMLPSIAANLDEAASQFKKGAEKVTEAVDTVGETVTDTVMSVTAGTKEAAEYIKVIAEVVQAVIAAFSRK